MSLTKNMSLSAMEDFLSMDLKEQILFEIVPILHLGYPSGGYFGVTRQIVCMIDFLGALYSGFDFKKDTILVKGKASKKIIASSRKALNFIEDIMGNTDRNYKKNGRYLIEMYRHGLVHLNQPKQLKLNDGKILQWLPYKGGRTTNIQVTQNRIIGNASHLTIVIDSGDFFLAVSIKCLYDDLLSSIDIYKKKLKESTELQSKWIAAANEIWEPDEFEYNSKSLEKET